MVPAQCYERTVQVNVPSGFGSGFTITRHNRQWLLTAQHVVDGVEVSEIEILWRGRPAPVQLHTVPQTYPGADIAAFLLQNDITPELSLFPTSDGAVFSQDVYFLGFPYGLGLRSDGITQLPFAKKGIIAGFEQELNGIKLWYLDGINNPGFSGGPVVFCRMGTQDWHVAGIVSGYRTESVSVRGGAGEIPINTGIVLAYDIAHGIESIDAYWATVTQ